MTKKNKPFSWPKLDFKLDFANKKQGFAAVLIGIIIALALGALASVYGWENNWIYVILTIGLILGILNIFHKEAIVFLISGLTIALMIEMLFMQNVFASATLFPKWTPILFKSVIYLLAPANIVVAIKVLYALATK